MEALGTSLLEAQACGVPVVASDTGGIPECVLAGKTGFLFPPQNIDALTHALIQLIDKPQLRLTMGQHARNFVTEQFSTDSMVRKTVQLYGETARS